ncbi:4-hydroxy-tetrahydrodipicolinate reductase [Haloplasma contractile]|uniref:4-hydroxy-tetrahydrodipicolinate reductase n=1 Tax=Haloplasma contractile SSD-17B TaxID=1033810 RepID=U2EBM7_9MOLU|nr:4-hydroxy-tetrahydrodipicolinate reductase [Haloplasma contractile]ERJ12473.1 4-hydroxy-tetrahydrodipicolinate reductase protein [Haloplasma contractile SSD-17B]
MIKTVLYGVNGKMGNVLRNKIKDSKEFTVVSGYNHENEDLNSYDFPIYNDINQFSAEADVIIDFSHPNNLKTLLEHANKKKIPTVIATTGYNEQQLREIKDASKKVPILLSSNMSLGINVITRVLRQLSSFLYNEDFDIEIIEKHHNKKIDSPSGTANLLANTINMELNQDNQYVHGRVGNETIRKKNEIGIHAVRGGTIPGEHQVIFAGDDEIIEFKHTALSKDIFALGAMKAAKFISKQSEGLYTMDDLFKL